MDMKDQIELEIKFGMLVRDYRNSIVDSFFSREGEEPDRQAMKEKVTELFQKIPPNEEAVRLKLQNIAFKTFFERVGIRADDRLHSWIHDLGGKLAEELN